MVSRLRSLKEEELRPLQQVVFVPYQAKGDLEHESVKFGFITSVAPSGLTIYCRFWKRDSLKAMQASVEVSELEMLENPTHGDGKSHNQLFQYQSIEQEKVQLMYNRIYRDSMVIASKFLKYCASVLDTPLTPSVQAGVRGEMKHVTFQDFRTGRISFVPSYGWEALELSTGVYWRSDRYNQFLQEVLVAAGEPIGEDAYWTILRSITIDGDKDATNFFYNTYKFKRGG